MRKLIMWNVITLDGYFEGNQAWDLSFHERVWGKEMEAFSLEQLHDADYLLFGRKTYEGMAAYWSNAPAEEQKDIALLMNSIPKLVCSKTLLSAEWNNSVLIKGNIAHELRKFKQENGKNIFLFGSANLSETLINEDLFDEYRICIAPVISGNGRPLFSNGLAPKNLSLLSAQPLQTGGVILRYARDK